MHLKSILLLSLLLSFNAFADHSNQINKEESPSAWLYKGQVLPPSTFKKEWMSSDNFEEFEEHFKIETKDCWTSDKYGFTHCRSEDFRNNTGQYFGREINNLDPIMASWGEPVSLAVAIDDVDFDQPYHFEETDHGIDVVHLTDGIGIYNGDERYQIMQDISLDECDLMAPYINGSCKEAYKVHVSTWNGGSMGHQNQIGIYGLFEMEDGKAYILPLKYIDDDAAIYFKEAKDILLNNLPKLTSLSSECVYLLEDGSTESYVGLNLREIHNDQCGGDPNTDVSIGFYRIDQDKELWEMDYLDGSYQRIGE